MMDTDFIAIGKHLIRLEEVFLDRLLTIESKFMTSASDLQAAVQASNDAITALSLSVDKLIALAAGNAASLAAAVQAAASAGTAVSDEAINKAIESLRGGVAAAAAEAQKVNAAIAADTAAPVAGTPVAETAAQVGVPESTPLAHDANVAIGATRFSDGQIQTAESQVAAQVALAAAAPAA